MWLTRVSIYQRVFMLMVILALVVLGVYSARQMPVELFPPIELPVITVIVPYPGATPEEVANQVTRPVEDALSGVQGLTHVSSRSMENLAAVTVEFPVGVNLNTAEADVRAKLEAVRSGLPREIESPTIMRTAVSGLPVLQIAISDWRGGRDLRRLVETDIKEPLLRVPGVSSVDVLGGAQREIQVALSNDRLRAYGLPIVAVPQALAAAAQDVPGGTVVQGSREQSVRAVGAFKSVSDIAATSLALSESRVVPLTDLGTVSEKQILPELITRLNQRSAVGLVIYKSAEVGTTQVAEGVKDELERLFAQPGRLPRGLGYHVVEDQSKMARENLADVEVAFALAVIFAVLVVYLFLHEVRGTVIVGLAIPTSVAAALLAMRLAGVGINTMSLLGLSLAVGILVDDAIVVLENIIRHLHRGEAPDQAALAGRSEIGLAAISITLVDVVVFVPIAFMGGVMGQFFRSFGLAVAASTLFSLFISFTLTPMMAASWLPTQPEIRRGRLLSALARLQSRMDAGYRRHLSWALKHRWQVVLISFASLAIALAVSWAGTHLELIPPSDQGEFAIRIELPSSASLAATDRIARLVEREVWGNRDVKAIFTQVGAQGAGLLGGGDTGPRYGEVLVVLKDRGSSWQRLLGIAPRQRAQAQVMAELGRKLASVKGAKIELRPIQVLLGAEAPVQIELTGMDEQRLALAAQQVAQALQQTPGVRDINVSSKLGRPEIKALIDRNRAAQFGVIEAQAAQAVRTSVAGEVAGKLQMPGGRSLDVRVQSAESDRKSQEQVGELVVGNMNGSPVLLKDVATIVQQAGPTQINHRDRQPVVAVSAGLQPDVAIGDIQARLEPALRRLRKPGISINWGGEAEELTATLGRVGTAMTLAILLVYMVMASLFGSLLMPLVVLVSLPVALVGALLALVITGTTLSIVSMIGLIMLVGLVGKNAILLVDYTETLRKRGRGRDQALLEASPTRLRPILMTTLAMIFGMLPIALSLGPGAETRAPLAIAVVGGLILSTLVTLFLIPVVYAQFDDLKTSLGARQG